MGTGMFSRCFGVQDSKLVALPLNTLFFCANNHLPVNEYTVIAWKPAERQK